MDVGPDPAVIAIIAAAAANQEHADGHFTLGQLVYGVAVVVAVAGLTVWAIGLIPIWV